MRPADEALDQPRLRITDVALLDNPTAQGTVFARARDPVVNENKPCSLRTYTGGQSQIDTLRAAQKHFLTPRTNGAVCHNGTRGPVWTEIVGAVDGVANRPISPWR